MAWFLSTYVKMEMGLLLLSVLPPSLREISLVMKKKNGGLRAKNVSNIQIILAKNEYIVKKSKLCILYFQQTQHNPNNEAGIMNCGIPKRDLCRIIYI